MRTPVPDTRKRTSAKPAARAATAKGEPARAKRAGAPSTQVAAPKTARSKTATPQAAAQPAAPQAAPPNNADISVLALQLLGRWQRVCNGHVAFANACACVFGAAVELNDFDDLILDYLCNKFPEQPAVAAWIKAAAAPAPQAPVSLRALLRKIAAAPAEAPGGQALAILRALETSIASIEEQHAA